MNRRKFLTSSLKGSVVLAAGNTLFLNEHLAQAAAGSPSQTLKITSRVLDINGKAAKVYGLEGANGFSGLNFNAGELFNVELVNQLDEPTLLHWHGLMPPWKDDGVPDNPAAALKPKEQRAYAFPVGAGGTHWMHAHTLQEQNLLAAPLIVRTELDRQQDEQDVVILLHDFSFTPAEELLAKLKRSSAKMPMDHMHHGMQMQAPQGESMQHMSMPEAAMDLNDIDYDAYLANDRTLADPQVTSVEKGGRIRLRVINGAASTGFTLSTGALKAQLIAVDGQPVVPVEGFEFPMSMGQRIDLRLQIPQQGGAFPILAIREGAREHSGVILATQGAVVRKIPLSGEQKHPALMADFESGLRAALPLETRRADHAFQLTLTGSMQGYDWGILGADQIKFSPGQRIEIALRNQSMMAHPIHLHGHHFQLVEWNGKRFSGAIRDTVLIAPHGRLVIAFDANNVGRWPLHCHHLYHMVTGMMVFADYSQGT